MNLRSAPCFTLPRRRLGLVAALLVAGLGVWLRGHFQSVLVVGHSMEPSLLPGDLLILDRQAYRDASPARDDVVVVWHHGERMVKRVVGLPGEEVEVRQSQLFVDEHAVPATHAMLAGYLDIGRGFLASDRYAVLGDNRSLSPAETVHAVVGPEAIAGRVVVRLSWREGRLEVLRPEPVDRARVAASTGAPFRPSARFPRHG